MTAGPLTRLWRFSRKRGTLPAEADLTAARAVTGWKKLVLDPSTRTATLTLEGMRLDAGGIAKGYAADEAMRVLKAQGIDRALIASGGDIDQPAASRRSRLDSHHRGNRHRKLGTTGFGLGQFRGRHRRWPTGTARWFHCWAVLRGGRRAGRQQPAATDVVRPQRGPVNLGRQRTVCRNQRRALLPYCEPVHRAGLDEPHPGDRDRPHRHPIGCAGHSLLHPGSRRRDCIDRLPTRGGSHSGQAGRRSNTHLEIQAGALKLVAEASARAAVEPPVFTFQCPFRKAGLK